MLSDDRRLTIAEELMDEAIEEAKVINVVIEDDSLPKNWQAIADGLKRVAQKIEMSEAIGYTQMVRCPHCHELLVSTETRQNEPAPMTKFIDMDKYTPNRKR